MEKKNNNNINFKEFDLFIQSCLDKYFYVEPWKKLYDRTGRLHRDIISDKSTIPDLIIYNKSFNKSDCFYESNFNSYVKFPRMRFILRPKYKKEYNPIVTYGNEEDAILYYKKPVSQLNLDDELNTNLNLIQNNNSLKSEKNELQNKKTFLTENKMEEEEEEEEPEWANDNVEDFNKIKIEFKAIPKVIENQVNKDIKLNNINNDKIKEEKEDKSIIDIDKFFMDENLEKNKSKNVETVDNFFENINNINRNALIHNNMMNNKNSNLNDFHNNNNDNSNNNEENYLNNKSKNSNEYFDIFDTGNRYKNIYVEDENSYNNDNNNNESKDDLDIIDIELSTRKEGKDKIIPKNNNLNTNNLLNNNLNNNLINFDNPNFINSNRRFLNNNYVNNINNNRNNLININNLNSFPSNNSYYAGNNLSNNLNSLNINYNNMYLPNNVQYIENNKELYIKNLNNMIYRYNLQNQLRSNINNNFVIHNNNIIPINNNINFIPLGCMRLNQNINNIPFNYNCGTSNPVNRNIINNNNINCLRPNNNEININYYQNKNEQKINNINNHIKNIEIPENIISNPLEYSDNPTNLIILKNINKKKWIVFEKDKGNYIHNFNTKELYEYLEENNTQESFNNITINDSETDYYFPTRELYDNLKKFYSKN